MRRQTIEVIRYRRIILVGEFPGDTAANPLPPSLSEPVFGDCETLDSFVPAVVTSPVLPPVPGSRKSGPRLIKRLLRPVEKLRNRSTPK